MNTPAATIFNDPSALATVKRIDALKKKERLGILTQQDLDALDERGCSPLSSVLEDYSKLGPAWRQDTILWLIKSGATLIGNDDPFSKLVNMSGQQQNLVLINRAIEHMLSHGGKNNPMFHLASGMPGYIAASPSLNVANKDEVEHIRKAWFVDTDEQGRTVSHHLWGENTILEMYHRSYCCADEGDKKTLESLWRRTHRVCWDVQNRLHDAGLHMGQADHSGTTALDLLQARIAQGQAFIDDAIAQEFPAAAAARSMIEEQTLDQMVLQPTCPSAKRHGRL